MIRIFKIAVIGVSLLLLIWLMNYIYYLDNNTTTVLPSFVDIVYLIPTNEAEIKKLVSPEQVLTSEQNLSVVVTSNWEVFNKLVSEGQIQAIIIHYAAIEQVNQQELQKLFDDKHLVVIGIDIPGDKLAEMIGKPDFYNEKSGRYIDTEYYFAYSSHPEQGWAKSTNDLLETEDDVGRMLQTIENHLRSGIVD